MLAFATEVTANPCRHTDLCGPLHSRQVDMRRSPKAVIGWAAQASATRGRSGAAQPGAV